jgi:hypothetical protein
VNELFETLREAVAALAAGDPGHRRFGAAHHRYALAPPLAAGDLAAIEAGLGAALPGDLRGFAVELTAGGAGPGYGLVPIDRAAACAIDGPPGLPWRRGLPLAHLGCGYAAIAVLDGDARGEVWIDARAIGIVRPIHGSFTAFYLDWIDRLAHARWPDAHVPPGRCALAGALSSYLARCEAQAGDAPGTLAGEALRAALGQLGPAAIAVAAESSVAWFDETDRVDPCIACARLVDQLAADGLARDAIAPGAVPRALR